MNAPEDHENDSGKHEVIFATVTNLLDGLLQMDW